MNINDALNILNLQGTVTQLEIKKAYKACSLKYHPDRNPAEAETMKLVNIAYDFLKQCGDPVSQTDGFVANDYSEEFNTVLNALFALQEQANIEIEICGNWIWITGETKPFAAKLGRKEGGIGCYFSKKKNGGCWYYRPAEYKSRNRKSCSMEEIRERHGSQKATRQNTNRALAA